MEWISVNDQLPQMVENYGDFKAKPYVLAIDGKNRMSIGYCVKYADGSGQTGYPSHNWVFAKPIGIVTHWMPLPEPPTP